jgi:predicted AAA+ superfamily ATPase
VLKSYYNDGIAKPPLYYYRDKERHEIDLLIESGDTLYPVEIKTTSDPVKSMAGAFAYLKNIPAKKVGEGAIICLAKERLPLTGETWVLPVNMI